MWKLTRTICVKVRGKTSRNKLTEGFQHRRIPKGIRITKMNQLQGLKGRGNTNDREVNDARTWVLQSIKGPLKWCANLLSPRTFKQPMASTVFCVTKEAFAGLIRKPMLPLGSKLVATCNFTDEQLALCISKTSEDRLSVRNTDVRELKPRPAWGVLLHKLILPRKGEEAPQSSQTDIHERERKESRDRDGSEAINLPTNLLGHVAQGCGAAMNHA